MLYQLDYCSPIGIVEITGTLQEITGVSFVERQEILFMKNEATPSVLVNCYEQLHEYFSGKRQHFEMPISYHGTAFQQAVWQALMTVPYGATKSYKEIASQIGNEKAVRAVGMTNRKNRIGIIIPCHRVIGADGKLTGYAGGLWRKEWLLAHEKKMAISFIKKSL